MISIKKCFFRALFFACLATVATIQAQRFNQFDVNQKRTGVWKKFHPNKRVKYVGAFKDGKEIGTFKFYSISNSKHPEATKVFHKNSDSVTVNYFYNTGQLKGKGMLFGRDKVGKWQYFYKKGTLFYEEMYEGGKLSGKSIVYYKETGTIAEKSMYKNDLRHGYSKNFSDECVLLEAVLYENGKANGLAKYFELNGNLKEKGVYKDGVRVGKWEFYMDGEIADNRKKKEARKNKISQKNR